MWKRSIGTFAGWRRLILLMLLISLPGCEHPRLFAPTGDDTVELPTDFSVEQPVIYVHTTGGFAGMNSGLLVYEDGRVALYDPFPMGGAFFAQLTAAEFAELRNLFITLDFIRMRRSYITPNTADMIYYDIYFRLEGTTYEVKADYLAAPGALRAIIDKISELERRLSQEMLRLEVSVPRDTLRAGESIELTFRVQNISSGPLKLVFNSGQSYDFFATRDFPIYTYNAATRHIVWNWAADKAFTLAIRTITLGRGEIVEYRTEWDGLDNNGEALAGQYWLAAKLTSQPGGETRPEQIIIVP